jgi:hypothetical protein
MLIHASWGQARRRKELFDTSYLGSLGILDGFSRSKRFLHGTESSIRFPNIS